MRTVVILGAGPAGLAAAHGALAAGAVVVVIDEAERVGGQFWRHHDRVTDPRLQHQWQLFERLDQMVRDAESHGRARIMSSTSGWRVDASDGITVQALTGPVDGADRDARTIHADALVIATGAHDRVLPIPGWTLPGVTSAGAAQAVAKRDGVTLGQRTVVAGAGPFLLPVAATLLRLGVTVPEVVEAASWGAIIRGWGCKPWRLNGATGKVGELGEYATALARHRVPYRAGWAVTGIHGRTRVEAVTVQRIDERWRPVAGSGRTIECDSVALGHGFTPRLEAAVQVGCAISADRFVVVDADQATSVAGVYAAGEVTGIAGADAALAEGVVAGFCAAGGTATDPRIRGARVRRRRSHEFAARLRTHDIGQGWSDWVEADTIVCRCESVRYGALLPYADAASRAFRLATRAGLGACQGRTCGRSIEDLTGRRYSYDNRPILSSVRLGELARAGDPATASDMTTRVVTEREQE